MIADLGGEGCRSELVTRERRGALGGADRLALDAHLASCGACRATRAVLEDFEEIDDVDVRDGVQILALSEVARRWQGRGARDARRRRVRAVAAAAVLVVCGGSASAAVWWWRRPASERASGRTSVAAVASPQNRSNRPLLLAATPLAPAPVALPAPVAREVAAAPPSPSAARPRARARDVASTGVEPVSAAALLQQATLARQSGESDRAAGLYRRLQREFPASPEAVLSAVPLGRLLIDGSYPRAALEQFDAYLARSHGGALIPEALYGRARALALLGDRSEERRTWERLCADFPGSAYAPLGRRRLAEPE